MGTTDVLRPSDGSLRRQGNRGNPEKAWRRMVEVERNQGPGSSSLEAARHAPSERRQLKDDVLA